MIAQLIKRQKPSVWIFLPIGVFLLFAAMGGGSSAANIRTLTTGALIWATQCVLGRQAPQRCAPFDAALPIHGRDLFAAKVFSDVADMWLCLIAVVAGIEVSTAATSGLVAFACETGAILTLGEMFLYAFPTAEIKVPLWWRVAVGATAWIAIYAVSKQADQTSAPIVVVLCALGCAIVFARTWRSFPEALQIAPKAPVTSTRRWPKLGLPSFAWLPIARALLGVGTLLAIFFLFVCDAFGLDSPFNQLLAIVVSWLTIWRTIWTLRTQQRWLFSLPISWHWIFLAIVMLPLGMLSLRCIPSSDGPARPQIVGFMVVAVIALLPGLFIGAFTEPHRIAWNRTRRFMALGLMWLVMAAIVVPGFMPNQGLMPAETWLMSIMPSRPPLFVATVCVVVGITYWQAYMGFRRMEVRPQRIVVGR